MVTGPSDGRAARLLDGAALALFAAHVALRLSLRGGDVAWGSNLFAHLLVPLAAAVWLTARALEGRLPWRLSGLEIPLALLAGVAMFSIFGASWRLGAMDGAAGLCAAILAAPLAIHLFGPQGRGALLGLMSAVVAIVALYGCVQYVELGELQTQREASQAIAAAGDSGEFERRLKAREPMSTLHYPNTFAGFLVLALPFVFGMVLDSRSKVATGAGILVLAAGAFCLWATGSVGGWVAAAAAGAAFGILEAIRRWPQWRRGLLVASGAVLGVTVILVIAGPLSPNSLAKKSDAIAIRDVYWDAAIRVSRAHPFGVGMNNFEDRFYEHKDDRQEEVRAVHNDYLQVLVELGIPGLLAFLALLAVAVLAALRPGETESPVPGACSPVAIGVGIAVGLLFAFGLQGSFGSLGTVAILVAIGQGVFLAMSRSGGVGTFTRIGLTAGLAGAAVHMLVDFDFWDPGFRLFFFLSLAMLMLTTRLDPPGEAGWAAAAVAAIIFFAIVLPPAAVVAPRFLEAEELASNAEQAEARNRDEEADALWERAASANRLDPSPAVHLALREFHRWIALVAQGGSADEARRADLVITILEDAGGRRPRYPAIEARLAEVHEALARRMREKSSGDGMEGATAGAHEAEAERHARRAVELYPTLAYNQYLLGRILDSTGRSTEAADCFREALRLSSLAARAPRLELDGPQVALATLRTGGDRERAVGIFREWRRGQSEERWRARLPLLTPEEKSIVDAAAESK